MSREDRELIQAEEVGYNLDTLLNVAKSRGYPSFRSVAELVGRLLSLKSKNGYESKLARGIFSFEESFVLASYLEMTPKEYCDAFLHGLFKQTREGHFVCKVDDPDRLIKAKTERRRMKDNKIKARKENRKELLKEIEELEGKV